MKRTNRFISLVAAAFFALVPMSANAATSHALSIDALNWLNGNIRISYEQAINDSLSWTLPWSASFNNDTAFWNTASAGSATGWAIAPAFGLKYYATGKAADHGLYAHGALMLPFARVTASGASATAVGLGYDVKVGYSYAFNCGFWIDSYLGFSAPAVSFTQTSAVTGVRPNAGMMIGYAW